MARVENNQIVACGDCAWRGKAERCSSTRFAGRDPVGVTALRQGDVHRLFCPQCGGPRIEIHQRKAQR